jgi:hypothetical protein
MESVQVIVRCTACGAEKVWPPAPQGPGDDVQRHECLKGPTLAIVSRLRADGTWSFHVRQTRSYAPTRRSEF